MFPPVRNRVPPLLGCATLLRRRMDYLAQCRETRRNIERIVSRLDIGSLIRDGVKEIDDNVLAPLRREKFPTKTDITSEEAEPYLLECLDRAERDIPTRAPEFTTRRWISYFHHLPPP